MEIPRHWRLKQQRYQLIGEKCPHCEELIFPPRDICPGVGCGQNTFTLPLISRTEKKYYNEKGIAVTERVKSTRMDVKELVYS
ncbi:MAG: hypothetical protein US68_C0003G0034 [Candidatus Shapirobacteria bacterium GW2011_GWE1_38_10]|uniref:ChsH2 rubredoxin-like zinc ribbon domain-containing protein n=1 Tax=Candidatus Shapirobacteria bacterium GW2011_GWE1_38_10 TaxID=1618488 RepID=A0A0G0I5T3_9BACT|nr:MAG: hypothetical protein US46_C0008G0004 [Candidatus Shapirobacteria bacterium GW2011_GWF2_37_20]KKQ50668.1 MAG: hypothetical protein US68_C0003G0034 [Candidatus Shapirobacteria bacterium GW2011_GWE1_38_10]KKQ64379.1 MAG: hypothetical protein US85_C0010G0011 [Candidatus Shapirobacteria bacterium GW2011_GWF1_38_23]HBP51631.1 hypothetical protein [Candidatus Shapirobacteria bacterium]